jgi:hypothetical protein
MAYLIWMGIADGVILASLFVWVIAAEIHGRSQRREAAMTARISTARVSRSNIRTPIGYQVAHHALTASARHHVAP